MIKVSKLLDNFANVVVIAVSVIVLMLLLRPYLSFGKLQESNKDRLMGMQLKLEGVNLSTSRGTLLVALQEGCAYCEKSMGFYRRLGKSTDIAKIQRVAVFPLSSPQPKYFLSKKSVENFTAVTADLESIGVEGTPTLILVGPTGKVTRVWRGLLSVEAEDNVFEILKSFQ